MRHSGSVLVVVLGLLAILAVVGVAFVTMSTLDRTTADSFALQTQMMLSADGAIEFVSHEMVLDVWEWYTGPLDSANLVQFYFTGKLLTGRKAGPDPLDPTKTYGACEPYDLPSAADDAWLSSPITDKKKPGRVSFQDDQTIRFGLRAKGTVTTKPGNWPDNLGLPVAEPASDLQPSDTLAWTNGIWIPNLVVPFNQYLVRTSVTVLDHNAMVNLNAHGNLDTGTWQYRDCRGNGYFISDVDPTQLGGSLDLNNLLVGSGSAPGCWGSGGPGNAKAGAILFENPAAGADIPFTLDEEFELRRLWGTYFTSRLERFWSDLSAMPNNYPKASLDSACASRLKATTVSWTAEVCGDGITSSHANASLLGSAWTGHNWSCPKPDLNTASAEAIYQALLNANAWADGDELKQIVANIVAFRSHSNDFDADFGGKVGAERQPFFSEVTVEGGDTRTIRVELFNPWPGDAYGDTDGLTVTDMTVVFGATTLPALSGKIAGGQCHPTIFTHTVTVPSGTPLADKLSSIQLKKGSIVLDEITKADITKLDGASRLYRPIDWEDEARGSVSNAILKVYIGDWKEGGTANFGTVNRERPSVAIPIRFPNCVSDNAPGLPPRPTTATGDFKAFARVGDLNQVLRGTGANFWPWVVTVAKLTARTSEPTVKFDWMKDINNLATPGAVSAARAANVLSAGGPWFDDLDNDNDGKKDNFDTGITDANQAGPPEFRVAGKINLNTATDEALNALGVGVGGVTGLKNTVRTLRGDQGTGGEVKPTIPILSPVEILPNSATPNSIEVRDDPFTRISNIATIRSDVFSIYGTVQVVNPARKDSAGNIPCTDTDTGVVRSRRFWALVDRSPALAFPPTDQTRFIQPRILNFQWLD